MLHLTGHNKGLYSIMHLLDCFDGCLCRKLVHLSLSKMMPCFGPQHNNLSLQSTILKLSKTWRKKFKELVTKLDQFNLNVSKTSAYLNKQPKLSTYIHSIILDQCCPRIRSTYLTLISRKVAHLLSHSLIGYFKHILNTLSLLLINLIFLLLYSINFGKVFIWFLP